MKRPTDKYNDPGPRTLRHLLVRGGLLLVTPSSHRQQDQRARDAAKAPDAFHRAPDRSLVIARGRAGETDRSRSSSTAPMPS
jgi:hypothetical protein